MKILLGIFLFFLLIINPMYCQTWVQKTTMPGGVGIDAPIAFAINNKLYVGGGWTGSTALNTFYEYDSATNSWSQKANMPGGVYSSGCFTLNGKGYVVGGANPSIVNTVYKYDPIANTWQVMNAFPGTARQNLPGFTYGTKGYICGGFIGGSTVIAETWQYNDITDSWTQLADIPGPGRNGPAWLVVNNQIFVGMGANSNSTAIYSDFYRFDPVANTYTQVASIPGARGGPANFTIGNTGYVGIGVGTSGFLNDFWKYDPVANTWTQTNNFGRPGSTNLYSVVAGSLPYVGCGIIGSGSYIIDNWTWASCNLIVDLGSDTILCSPSTITLTDTFSNAHSLWSTGDTTASITVSASGSYWLQVTQGACIGRDTINITVFNPAAAFDLGNDTTYCGSFSRTLSTGNPATQWSTGTTGGQITVTTPGTYWAEISSPCGIQSDTIVISQNLIPTVDLGNDTNICNSNPLTLNATTSSATYLWQNATTNPTLAVSSSGTYWVAVTVGGCIGRDSIVVSFIDPLSFDIGSDTTYCGGFTRTITAGVAHTIWSTGDTATSITVTAPGTYWAVAFACGDTLADTIIISQKPLPLVDLGNDTPICPGKSITLNAGNVGASYEWQNNTTAQTLTTSSAGIYWVNVTLNGCIGTDSIIISALPVPVPFTLGSDTAICDDSSIVLNAYQSGAAYFWNNGDTTHSIIVSQSGQYVVIDSNACGSYSASVTVTTEQCICKVAIPTAFSPNNDSKNDFYYILTQCPLQNFQFDIYNRWGQKIFASTNVTDKWDGSYRGQQQPIGVYVYFLRYTDPYTGKETTQTGNVTLLR